ncbi:MAG: nucleotidyltransferase domain-containing protein [Planctomycetota bacterium]
MDAHSQTPLILSIGPQVVTLVEIRGLNGKIAHPRGAVGVVLLQPVDISHAYRVRFPDETEASLTRSEIVPLATYKQHSLSEADALLSQHNLFDRVIYRCVVGSRAYGLDHENSDTDLRGIYLPPADLHWSLYGVPDQLEIKSSDEAYWELQKFVTLALKANPNILECLYTPLVQLVTPLAQELLDIRELFLSRLVYQTFNGYVLSQFKKIQTDIRNQGRMKWKHVMHLIRLLLTGIATLKEHRVPIRVEQHRDQLLEIKAGLLAWDDIDRWRLQLHREFEAAADTTSLPERPDYEAANRFLITARRRALEDGLP